MTTTDVENYPGFPDGIVGPLLMENFKKQAQRFGTACLAEDISEIDLSSHPYRVKGKGEGMEAYSVIIATGATANRLDVPGTRDGELWQKGVTACAVCDGAMPIFRNRDLYVVGGGDAAAEEAIFLTKFGSRVFVVHRRDQLRASKIMQKRLLSHPKVEVLWNRILVAVGGDTVVRSVTLEDVESKEREEREAGGVFFAVGHTPNTAFLKGQLELDDNGYIVAAPDSTRTSKRFVYAAGDVRDHVYRQAVTAAGNGCMAAIEAERDLSAEGLLE